MTEKERKRWVGLCVILTGMTLALQALKTGDHASARNAIDETAAALREWGGDLAVAIDVDDLTAPKGTDS